MGGWLDQMEIRLTSALVWVEVELSWVVAELGNKDELKNGYILNDEDNPKNVFVLNNENDVNNEVNCSQARKAMSCPN